MKFGYVPQTAVMFTGTVNENVGFGQRADREYSSEDIKAALDISQSEEFVSKMLDGKESRIAQGGKNLSGGQKQRLSIARAIARDPKIYIFDDSFSALDYKTERQVRDGLKKVAKDSITFIVAQRIGTIRECDKIVVLNEGLIAGIGTHSELMKNCEVYQEIALSQLSKEELE
jgi:ATP-binding cassette, subfamily B, multidrug efflux pump